MDKAEDVALTYGDDDERRRTAAARQALERTHFDARTVALVTLATLAILYTLEVAAAIILPFLLALVLNLLLAPAKRLMTDRLRLPAMLVSLLLIAVLFVVVAGIGFAISVPASNWISKAPQSLSTLQERLSFLREPIGFLRHGMDQVQHLMQQPPQPGQQPPMPVEQPSSFGGVGMTILEGTRAALGQVLTLVVVLFFLLSNGDSLLRRTVEVLPSFGDKRRVVEIASEIERNISGYLLTITAMNALVGLGNGLSMWVQGMPDPLLWGTLAFLLNYIPVLGPVVGMVVFFFVGLFSSPSIWPALLPPAVYFVIHVIEGETVTPMLLARRFTLNPVLVILALFFWDWMWGVIGALLAVPLLAISKIVCDRIPALMPIGHVLGAPRKGGREGS